MKKLGLLLVAGMLLVGCDNPAPAEAPTSTAPAPQPTPSMLAPVK
ncbi:hypothetical protein ACS5PJ_14505 [Pseudarthrobacter sp. YS3]